MNYEKESMSISMASTNSRPYQLKYSPDVENAIRDVAATLKGKYRLTKRAMSLLLIQSDSEIMALVNQVEGNNYQSVTAALERVRELYGNGLDTVITLERRSAVLAISAKVLVHPEKAVVPMSERLGRLCMSPITGLPVLAIAVWFGLYQFVGVFGGQTLVDLLQHRLFEHIVNPWVTGHVNRLIPWPVLSELFVGEYGMWTLGITYAVALIFPIVGTFFLAFSVLEDSGYFPRLAMLIDRLFKSIGLNGKAVIPIVLGFGCDTMATIVTRILETRRERLIATFLLSLAIPCSAQLGVMAAMLAGHTAAFGLWIGIMVGIFVVIGYLTAKLLPGEPARFAMELPPLRWPSLSNILTKTLSRMQWYFMEVVPLFLFASFAIWLGRLIGLFDLLVNILHPVVKLLGLPPQAAEAFLFGFFRRDYGAAGLYRLQHHGGLTGNQLLVSVVTLTVFLPCIAQFLMMKKERGLKTALAIAGFILPFALFVGASINFILKLTGVQL